MPATILIVDDERNTREGLQLALEDEFDVYVASNGEEAFRLMEMEQFEVILTDLRMAGISGMKVIERAMTLPNRPACIMITAYGTVEAAVEAMKRGAFDFMTKPVNLENLEVLIRRAIKARTAAPLHTQESSTSAPLTPAKKKLSVPHKIVGSSYALHGVLEKVSLVAPTKTSVLVYGETGTGKELIARAIHENSDRQHKPFVAVHCAALADNLLESELFGHEKGAFTGATAQRIGRFEAAQGGTLFLDEIGEINASTQVKLLRFLETHQIERLGGTKSIPLDIRLVCATNRNLDKMVRDGSFREDLLYRLNVVVITLPSLRERGAIDILELLDHYLKQFSAEYNLPMVNFDEGAKRVLAEYNWPGNIRELRNFCESSIVMRQGKTVHANDLEGKFTAPNLSVPASDKVTAIPFPPTQTLSKEENEKQLISNALTRTGGNKSKAAELLGISRRTLHRKLNQWPDLD